MASYEINCTQHSVNEVSIQIDTISTFMHTITCSKLPGEYHDHNVILPEIRQDIM